MIFPLFIEIIHFKEFNDKKGHLAGDEILRNVGSLINKSIREGVDSGYRYGGDEFAIILIDSDIDIAEEIGKRIQAGMSENGKITASLGLTKFSDGMSDIDLVSKADKNLYRAKQKRTKNQHNK